MIGRALLAVPLVVGLSFFPGVIFVRRRRWHPFEKMTGAIACSLILLFVLTFGVYWAHLPRAAYAGIAVVALVLSAAAARDALRLLRMRVVRPLVTAFLLLATWTVGLQLLIRHYSGGDWCCDWVEHYQRSLFFLEGWPRDFLFIGRYAVTARPPFMNVVCAFFLGLAGTEFGVYQLVFSTLNLLVFFPCCLFGRLAAPWTARSASLVAILLGANPMFFMNTTFPWTKVLAAFFVVLGVCWYLIGWRKKDSVRIGAAFLSLAAGTMVHFSTAPYAVILAGMYVVTVWPRERRRVRALALAALPAVLLAAYWLTWTVSVYGPRSTFAGNVTVEAASTMTAVENLRRIAMNTFHTFRPYLFPGAPGDTPLRLLTDRAFTFYQENFLGAIGSLNAYVAIWIAVTLTCFARSRVPARERRFWLAFVPLAMVIGIAVDSEVTPSGFANICLQPLVYLAVTLVAVRFEGLGRGLRQLIWCGLAIDFVLGVGLEIFMESRMQAWTRTPNWDWKRDYHLVYLGDRALRAAPLIELALLGAAAAVFFYLGQRAMAHSHARGPA